MCLHAGFACATPTPRDAVKFRKGDREGLNRVVSEQLLEVIKKVKLLLLLQCREDVYIELN